MSAAAGAGAEVVAEEEPPVHVRPFHFLGVHVVRMSALQHHHLHSRQRERRRPRAKVCVARAPAEGQGANGGPPTKLHVFAAAAVFSVLTEAGTFSDMSLEAQAPPDKRDAFPSVAGYCTPPPGHFHPTSTECKRCCGQGGQEWRRGDHTGGPEFSLRGRGSEGGCAPPPPRGEAEVLEAPKAPNKFFGLN